MAKKIFFSFVVVGVLCFLLWAVKDYFELPVVEFSVSHQKVVAVKNFKGETLPFPPLPSKYEKVYVK
ncbi:MAG: hypothetical protein NTV77_02270 [Candidatus Azambacteria bacterium]|nr:hypothetical protein [Candidatus Azambacteria bacterium]